MYSEKLQKYYKELEINEKEQEFINSFLNLLKVKDVTTYTHSLLTAFLGVDVAEFISFDPKIFFYAGLLHDTGKLLIPNETLTKKKDFNEDDWREIRKHPLYSYLLLIDTHVFTAIMSLKHHTHQDDPYPETLPDLKVHLGHTTLVDIDFYSRLFSIIDFLQASSRKNDKLTKDGFLSQAQIKDILLAHHRDQSYLIKKFYDAGIFGTGLEKYLDESKDDTVAIKTLERQYGIKIPETHLL